MNGFLAAGLLVATALAASGCSAQACPSDGTGDVQVFDIHVGSNADGTMYLTPGNIAVSHCAKVQFKVHNDDTIFHDVALLNYGGDSVEHEVEAGQTVTTHHAGTDYFVAKVTGTFPIICEVKGHADKGMKGTFTVK